MMGPLRDVLTRMQSQATACVALLLVDLADGTVIESCSDDEATSVPEVARVLRDLFAPQPVILPRLATPAEGETPEEAIFLAEDCTYVCRRLSNLPHRGVAAVCRGPRNIGLIAGLLQSEIAREDVR